MLDALIRLLEPPIEALGFELVDIEIAREGRGGVLRIFIDRRAADSAASVTVDDCASVSHAVIEVLEIHAPIKGHYTLEVSSPGVDRVLSKRAHFERFVGEAHHRIGQSRAPVLRDGRAAAQREREKSERAESRLQSAPPIMSRAS